MNRLRAVFLCPERRMNMVIMLVILAYANGYTIPTIGWVFFALYCAFNAVAAIAKAISS